MSEKIMQKGKQWIRSVLPDLQKTILQYYGPGIEVELKSDDTPVTRADREAELFLRNEIEREFPGHGIVGEEFGDTRPGADFYWVLDPIDGTKSFVAGAPLFGTLIALMHQEQAILGAIYFPVTGDLLIGDHHSTELNGKSIRMTQEVELKQATVLTTDEKDFAKYKPRRGYENLLEQTRLARTWGDCFGYYLLVTGGAHIMIDPIMSFWDKAALVPVVRGAGGEITDYFGNDPLKGDSIVATVKSLHAQTIEILNRA